MAPLTVIIPTLNEAETLPALLHRLAEAGPFVARVIVADGGSTDATAEIARRHGALVLSGPPGRGHQLRRGAAAAATAWLWLLHADSLLPDSWPQTLATTLATADPARAHYGRLRFASADPRARLFERLVALRCRLLALPYGDQSLLIRADLLSRIGGVPDLKLMEDVALARRLGRRRLAPMKLVIKTDASAYHRDGWFRRAARNLLRLARYLAGADPAALAVRYSR